jgi:diguanylate cyclase (GGDEF)-like protein
MGEVSSSGIDILELIRNRKLRATLYSAGFFFADYRRGITSASKVMAALGWGTGDMKAEFFIERVHPHDVQSYSTLWQRIQDGWEEEFYCEYRFRAADDSYHWVSTHALVIDRAHDGSIQVITGIDENIDSRKHAEEYLRTQFLETKRRFEVAESLRVAGTVVTSDLELEKSLDVGLEQLKHIVEYDRVEVFLLEGDEYRSLATRGEYPGGAVPSVDPLVDATVESMFPVIRDDLGEGHTLRSWIGVPLRIGGVVAGAVLLWHEQAGFYRAADLYPVMAFGDSLAVAINNGQRFLRTIADLETDELTGFHTRRSFERNAATLWTNLASRFEETAVVMMDLDRFKDFNERYGHSAGDRVLRAVGEVCRATLRKGDLLGRYGGEEFIAILPGAGKDATTRIMERIRRGCEELDLSNIEEAVTISVGVAVSSGDGDLARYVGGRGRGPFAGQVSGEKPDHLRAAGSLGIRPLNVAFKRRISAGTTTGERGNSPGVVQKRA